MRKRWQVVTAFAETGVFAAALAYAWNLAYLSHTAMAGTPLSSVLTFFSILFCPAQFLFAWCIDCDVQGWDGFVMYSIIAGANAIVYTVAGIAITHGWKPSSREKA